MINGGIVFIILSKIVQRCKDLHEITGARV